MRREIEDPVVVELVMPQFLLARRIAEQHAVPRRAERPGNRMHLSSRLRQRREIAQHLRCDRALAAAPGRQSIPAR